MASLYNISMELENLFAQIEEQEGEVTEEQLKKLEITENNLLEKVDNYVKVIKE